MSDRQISVVILLANGSHAKGGIEKYAFYLINQIEENHENIKITETISRKDLPGLLKHISIIPCFIRFCSFIFSKRVDIIHVNLAPRGSTFRKIPYIFVSKLTRKKIILHLHGGGYEDFFDKRSCIVRHIIKFLFESADKVVILNDNSREFVTIKIGLLPERVVALGNGVPAATEMAAPWHVIPTICFMGRLIPIKGIDILLEAFGLLKQRGIDFRAVIGGDGDIDVFQRLAHGLGLDDEVEFLGWLNGQEVTRQYSMADIFVLSSRVENQPMAILEAMAHRLPVVATDVGAVSSQVIDGTTGLVIAPGDAKILADALERLCRDPALRRTMGEAGYDRWQAHFSIATAATRMVDLYHELVTESGRQP
ncbi:glycosyltransferase family 4 protein [Sphingopyxis panaciterrulae]|uniref:Glycosyltransferase involved in cell wall biosynthesis n=1 Tax=Sphingopyxis panaciterrulae TaxID=462372 RepID=A0A7W9B7A8_9SPHN|nr:glycosyltransferase family 4 protein [Sphingopyxis panaciterrulae]MBB5707604.1 glycosyltransferase involved in cell wall biosynthesis [Sphingopyxis panaciterrulae]